MSSRINAEKESLYYKQLAVSTKDKLDSIIFETRNLFRIATSEPFMNQDIKLKLEKALSDIEELYNAEVKINTTQNNNSNNKK